MQNYIAHYQDGVKAIIRTTSKSMTDAIVAAHKAAKRYDFDDSECSVRPIDAETAQREADILPVINQNGAQVA